jgi:hypothetical protein
MAQSGINRIVLDHKVGQEQTSRHIQRLMWIFTMLMVFVFVWNLIIQARIERTIGEPQPALASIVVSTAVVNPIVCPGDVLHYALTIQVTKPLVGKSIVVVRNLDTMFPELSSSSDSIYDTPGTVKIGTDWKIPALIPATLTRPERPWQPGQYRRSFAIATANSNTETPISHVDFRIAKDCKG